MFNRRAFLKATVAAQVFGGSFLSALKALSKSKSSLSEIGEAATLPEEDFWKLVREHFLIKNGIYLNNGTIGASPRPVLEAVIDHIIRVEEMFTDPGVDIAELKRKLAEFVHAKPEEIAITRNTTEGMNFVANGLTLKRGDVVLTTDQEHVGGLCCWQLKAKREGLELIQLPIPMPPQRPEEILNIFADALRKYKRTRVISVSHLMFTTGLLVPVKKLCQLAREKGIISVIDGAHPLGMIPLDLHDLGCDFYASSPHKWLLAPKGTGFLYLRDDMQDQVWTTIASGGWDDLSLRASRFDHVGTINNSLLVGLGQAVDFQNIIGKERIAGRIRTLHQYFKEKLAQIPKVEMATSLKAELSCGAASFKIKSVPHTQIADILMAQKKIRVRLVSEYNYNLVRISTHIYNSFEQVDTCLDILKGIAEGKYKS